MPFVCPELKMRHYALIVGFVAMFGFGELVGIHQEREARNSLIDPNAQVLLTKALPPSFNPNDALLLSVFLPQAKTCYNCNALREFNDKLYYTSLPVVFRVKGEEVGNTSDVAYTMVFGIVSEDIQGGGQQTLPRIIYYVGHRSGSLARIDESGNVQYRYGSDEWRPAKDGSVLVSEVRQVFQQKWQNELASPRIQ